jgi:hypothetical protein
MGRLLVSVCSRARELHEEARRDETGELGPSTTQTGALGPLFSFAGLLTHNNT